MIVNVIPHQNSITSIANGATDTDTVSISAGDYVRVYGALVSFALPSASTTALFKVTVGSTEILNAAIPAGSNQINQMNLPFPSGTCYEGADGEDIVTTIEASGGSGNFVATEVVVFYSLHKSATGV